jgi:hypothetical protein
MILGFKTQIAGQPTFFVEKIRACVSPIHEKTWTPKIHTIRTGNRWKAGMKMHLATGVRTADYYQFNIGEYSALAHCTSVQSIQIDHNARLGKRVFVEDDQDSIFTKQLSDVEIELLSINDGFDSVDEFWNWFQHDFVGQIIHFTDFRY